MRLGLEEGQQIGVDQVRVGLRHAVGQAGIGLQQKQGRVGLPEDQLEPRENGLCPHFRRTWGGPWTQANEAWVRHED
jgi:hypothetical protein